jgi:protein-L-isoaspartate(D-aspartate) O-methyltransferase
MVLMSDPEDDFVRLRSQMVEEQLKGRSISDPGVLQAMGEIPRHLFVPEELRKQAYEDGPLPIGHDQTISQPYMAALMTEKLCLTGAETVLEVGTGSGYQAAVLFRLAARVISVEQNLQLSEAARRILSHLGFMDRITLVVGDGSVGFSECAPFDRIIVTAGSPCIPRSLMGQLKEGGILILPLGERAHQILLRITKTAEGLKTEELVDCTFVPLVGEEGWGGTGEAEDE